MAKEIFEIDPNMLKEHNKASALIPGMSEKEWGDFFENVMQVGIRQPLDINTSYEVLDGRHRLKAAKKLGLNTVKVVQHDLTPDEEMKFVRDTAIERRNLTEVQRTNIVLEAEELIKTLYEKGKEQKTGRPTKNEKFSYADENIKKPHNSVKKIADIAGVSHPYVSRVKKLKKENPEGFKEVLNGEKGVWTAYNNLPSVKENKGKFKRKNDNVSDGYERGDTDVVGERLPKPKQLNQKPPELPKEEIEKQRMEAKVKTLHRHLSELEGFINRNENVTEVFEKALEHDRDSFRKFIKPLEQTIKLLNVEE
jgi:hypothetical protein